MVPVSSNKMLKRRADGEKPWEWMMYSPRHNPSLGLGALHQTSRSSWTGMMGSVWHNCTELCTSGCSSTLVHTQHWALPATLWKRQECSWAVYSWARVLSVFYPLFPFQAVFDMFNITPIYMDLFKKTLSHVNRPKAPNKLILSSVFPIISSSTNKYN